MEIDAKREQMTSDAQVANMTSLCESAHEILRHNVTILQNSDAQFFATCKHRVHLLTKLQHLGFFAGHLARSSNATSAKDSFADCANP